MLKPFNIEVAKSGNARVVTRDGQPVRILCYDRKTMCDPSLAQPIVALVGRESQTTCNYCADGRFHLTGMDSNLDLFLAVPKETGIVLFYLDGDGETKAHPTIFDDWDEAEEAAQHLEGWMGSQEFEIWQKSDNDD